MKRVGVLLGGPSSEHEISILSGLNVLRALRDRGQYEAVPIFITQNGAWLFGDKQAWMSPTEALAHVDLIFNALHGEYGEDGTVQQILDHHKIPYTGSRALPSAVAMNKEMAADILKRAGLRVPKGVVLGPKNMDTRSILALSSPPWIIKPRSRGSSVGVSKVATHADIPAALQKAFATDSHVIAQEYIPGREITCGMLQSAGWRINGKPLAVLAPIEIVPPKDAEFFDYRVKYNGKTQEICPAEFYGAMLAKIQETALRAHEALGLRHYSRTDMIIKSSKQTRRAPEIYVLEVNTLPGLTSESLLPRAARHAGLEFPDLIDHLVKLSGVV